MVGADGFVVDFSMNDKCVAGTGCFLFVAVDVIGVGLDEIGVLLFLVKNLVWFIFVCIVFVEFDIMSYFVQCKIVEDILGDVYKVIAMWIMSFVWCVGVVDEVIFMGGVLKNVGMVRALEEVLGWVINVSEEGYFIGCNG